MATSESFTELGQKLALAADNVIAARNANFRGAQRRLQPRFRDQARRAAGGNRILSRHRNKSALDAKFNVRETKTSSFLFIDPVGPWGIRDNTDSSGRTDAHVIVPKRFKYLRFTTEDGVTVYARRVYHPGSRREAYWGGARLEAFFQMSRNIPIDTMRAIESALLHSGFIARR